MTDQATRRGLQAVIFDLDGTLVDSAPAIRDVGDAVLGELGLAPLDLAETKRFIGAGAAVFLERALAARGRAVDPAERARLHARFEEIYAAQPGSANPAFPGVDAALETLRAQGLRLALCTNKPAAPTRAVLAARGWDGLFETVRDGDSLPAKKPDPSALRAVLDDLGDARALFVGDSEVDAAAAIATRVPFVLFTEGYRQAPPSALPHLGAFDAYSELPALIRRLRRAVA